MPISPTKCRPNKRDLENEFVLALNQSFKLPDATTFNTRKGHDQTEWRESIEKLYEVHKMVPEMDSAPLQGDLSTEQLSPQVSTSKKIPKKAKGAKGAKEVELAWCPVLKDFIPKNKGVVAHIIPHALGYRLVKKIFEDSKQGKALVFSLRNGLWMAKNVEQVFDKARVILVPNNTENLDFEEQTYDLKLVVLDKTLLDSNNNMIMSVKLSETEVKKYYWGDVDGKTLNFRKAKARPAKKFLFFNYLYTTCRIIEQKVPQFDDRLETLRNMGRSWATPGSYLARGLLDTMKARVERQLPAHLPPHIGHNEHDGQDTIPHTYPAPFNVSSTQDLKTIAPDEGMQIASSMLEHRHELFIPGGSESGYESELNDENLGKSVAKDGCLATRDIEEKMINKLDI